jgi:hypothetical protein
MGEIDSMADLNVITEVRSVKKRCVGYVREMSLTSTSSKDHLLNNLTVPSPTISAERIAVWVTGSSPAVHN